MIQNAPFSRGASARKNKAEVTSVVPLGEGIQARLESMQLNRSEGFDIGVTARIAAWSDATPRSDSGKSGRPTVLSSARPLIGRNHLGAPRARHHMSHVDLA